MKGRRHMPEQIVRKLREADRLLGEGKNVAEVAKSWASASTPSAASGTSPAA
jgi:hypothetical protein